MDYKKCPRCELNLISEEQELCDVCKSEIGYRKPAGRNDNDIYWYIFNIFTDFQNYLVSSETLCDLKNTTFEGNSFPQYRNFHVQQLYLLRYTYAYAYEYKCMYRDLFKSVSFDSEISITSVGCGNMIDYWSLREVLEENGNDDTVINYTGLDLIDWQYKVKRRTGDSINFNQGDAIKYFEGAAQLDSDVYFFPKSISEFGYPNFVKLCNCFRNKPILKDKFSLLVSIRPADNRGRSDIDKVVELVNAITSNGFVTDGNPNSYYYAVNADGAISYLDPKFTYPSGIKETLKNLKSRCSSEKAELLDCSKCDKIDRSPILTARYVQYQLFTFYREKGK